MCLKSESWVDIYTTDNNNNLKYDVRKAGNVIGLWKKEVQNLLIYTTCDVSFIQNVSPDSQMWCGHLLAGLMNAPTVVGRLSSWSAAGFRE